MKRFLTPLAVLSAILLAACGKVSGEGWIVDWAPVNIHIEAVDDDNNSIISPDMPGMTLSFKGQTYEVQPAESEDGTETKAYAAMMRGLLAVPMYETDGKTVYKLVFGEIDGAADMDEDITLDWPDGSRDVIHYHCSDHREGRHPKCNRSWKLNGKTHEGSTFRFSGKKPGKDNPGSEDTTEGNLLLAIEPFFDGAYSTKADIDLSSGNVSFTEGDRLLVYIPDAGGKKTGVYRFDGTIFVPEEEKGLAIGDNHAFVYYPTDAFSAEAADTVTFTIPSAVSDSLDLGSKAPMSGVIIEGSTDSEGKARVVFRNLCSILNLKVSTERQIKSVTLSNGNIPVAASDEYIVNWSGHSSSDSPSLSSSMTGYSATITCSSVPSDGVPADFYFLLPVTAETMQDARVTVEFTTTGGGVTDKYEYAIPGSIALKEEGRCRIVTISFRTGPFSGGSGTAENPYLIGSTGDFEQFLSCCKSGYGDLDAAHFRIAAYRQTADLDLGSITGFAPVGPTASENFRGSYDGGNFSIRSLNIKVTEKKNAALFGNCGTGTVLKNIHLEGLSVKSSYAYAAGIVGYLYRGAVENCSVSGEVVSEGNADNKSYTGGVAGRVFDSTVKNCLFSGKITASSNHSGGIAGTCDGNTVISGCLFSKGSVIQCNYYCAGIAASLSGDEALIEDCICEGAVSSTNWNCGGIVAVLYRGKVSSCVQSNVSIVNSGNCNAGGIAGSIATSSSDGNYKAVIDKCVSYGTVRGLYQVGGICGLCSVPNSGESAVILNSACQGSTIVATGVNSSSYSLAGGLCGFLNGSGSISLLNSYSRPAAVNATCATSILGIGALAGYSNSASHSVVNCYSGASPAEIQFCGSPATSSSLTCYGSIFGRASAQASVTHCFHNNTLQFSPSAESNETASACKGFTVSQMTDGTLLASMNDGIADIEGALTWAATEGSYPTLQGLPSDPEPTVVKKRVSIIGDSISTYRGWIQGDNVDGRYCSYHYPKKDITSVEQTWWYRLIYDYMKNACFEMNISGGNTTVVQNTTAASYSSQYWYGWDFNTRFIYFKGVGNPDVVFIHGGTNDLGHISSYGASEMLIEGLPMDSSSEVSSSALSRLFEAADACTTLAQAEALDFSTFCSAYIKLVKMVRLRYPSVKTVCIIGDCVSPGMQSAIKSIAGHYGARYVDFLAINGYRGSYPLTKYEGNVVHPDSDGMAFMAKTIYEQLGTWLDN